MRNAVLSLLTAAIAVSPAPAQKASVAATGDGQTIRIGKTTIARPFGAELVDRLTLVSSYTLGGRRVHLVRGDAGGTCASRFVFVTEQAGTAPVTSSPFGTCSPTIRVRTAGRTLTATISDATGASPPVQYAFDGGWVRTLGAEAADVSECVPAAQVDGVAQVAAVTVFEDEYPRAYQSLGGLRKSAIDPEEMRALVTTMACLAPWPAAERRIPRIATPLFASRHGPAAFAALEAIAKDPTSDAHLRASARGFAAEMVYRVERREPL